MNKIKHVIFDLDGTLIHSAPDIHAAINDALAALDRPALDLDTVISFIGNGVETLVARSLHHTGGGDDAVQATSLARFLSSYDEDPTSRTNPYPGVVDCLESLAAQGIKLAICTNKPTGPARDICAALDLTRHFDVIAGADAGRAKKPDPEPLLRVMQALGGSAADTIYVGDSAIDQATARNADVPFVLFTQGYLNSELSSPAPMVSFADWASDWMSELS